MENFANFYDNDGLRKIKFCTKYIIRFSTNVDSPEKRGTYCIKKDLIRVQSKDQGNGLHGITSPVSSVCIILSYNIYYVLH